MEGREASRVSPSEPPGLMMGPTPYPNSSMAIPSSGGLMSGMRLSFNQMVAPGSKPVDEGSSLFHGDGASSIRQCGVISVSEPVKKKRGRPRKYGPDGNIALGFGGVSSSLGYPNVNGSPMMSPNGTPISGPNAKKRGRPLGSGRKQQRDALGAPGISFTPHVITVQAGEDVAAKIMAFSQQGPRTVCILSANGAISNVTLRQPASSGGTVSLEGRFEIISLSGSFLFTEDSGTRSRTGGLSVSLAGSDGRVLGGSVAGMLRAATPVQVVVSSFIAEGKKPKPIKHEPLSSLLPPQMPGFGAASASSPPTQGSSGRSSDDDDDDNDDDETGSPAMNLNSNFGSYSSSGHLAQPMLSYSPIGVWANHGNHQPRHDSDIRTNRDGRS